MLLVGMSANAVPSEQDQAFQAGMHIFLSKPVDMEYIGWILSEKKSHVSIGDLVFAIKLMINLSAKPNRGVVRFYTQLLRPDSTIESIQIKEEGSSRDKKNYFNNRKKVSMMKFLSSSIGSSDDGKDTEPGKEYANIQEATPVEVHTGERCKIHHPWPVASSVFLPSSSDSGRSLSLKILKILIVDDCLSVRKMLKRWLERNDCLVTTAENGLEGLDLWRQQSFDITFMDFVMVRKVYKNNHYFLL